MTTLYADRTKETAQVTGTAAVPLAGAEKGFRSFAGAGLANGQDTYFCISDPVTGDWEIQRNTYAASTNTLNRAAAAPYGVVSSSNGNALVNFQGNACDVFMTIPAVVINALLALPGA
jgi:hypothetical protein